MCYTNVLQILDLSQIPIWAKDRTDNDPIVMGGGPCTYNPEPIADFFDFILDCFDVSPFCHLGKHKVACDCSGDFVSLVAHIFKVEPKVKFIFASVFFVLVSKLI